MKWPSNLLSLVLAVLVSQMNAVLSKGEEAEFDLTSLIRYYKSYKVSYRGR